MDQCVHIISHTESTEALRSLLYTKYKIQNTKYRKFCYDLKQMFVFTLSRRHYVTPRSQWRVNMVFIFKNPNSPPPLPHTHTDKQPVMHTNTHANKNRVHTYIYADIIHDKTSSRRERPEDNQKYNNSCLCFMHSCVCVRERAINHLCVSRSDRTGCMD